MSLPRFYIPPPAWDPHSLVLEDGEAKHCASVMRKSAGDVVVVFNGEGASIKAQITSASPKRVELEKIEATTTPAPKVTLTLLQAIPKGANMELIIEKAVELGVNAIHPVLTEHTVVRLDHAAAVKKQAKWQQTALEACKQCGQNWLPIVHVPVSFEQAWRDLPAHDLRLIAALEPDSKTLKSLLGRRPATLRSVLMAVGPEGDFSVSEYALARAMHCQPISLGPIILRVETAAMFSLSVLNHELHRHDAESPAGQE